MLMFYCFKPSRRAWDNILTSPSLSEELIFLHKASIIPAVITSLLPYVSCSQTVWHIQPLCSIW